MRNDTIAPLSRGARTAALILSASAEDRRRAIREAAEVARKEGAVLGELAIGEAIAKAILKMID